MSNIIPMVSSSPPPFDEVPSFDDGWEDEDDDEFGNFTGAETNKDFTDIANCTLPSPDREIPPSPDAQQQLASKQSKPSHVIGLDFKTDNGEELNDSGQGSFNSLSGAQQKPSSLDLHVPLASKPGNVSTNGSFDASDMTGLPSSHITDKLASDCESPSCNPDNWLTNQSEREGRKRESTTDSGMCSSDISPIPKSDNTTDFCDSKSSGSDMDEMFTEGRPNSSPSSESAGVLTDCNITSSEQVGTNESQSIAPAISQGSRKLTVSPAADIMVEGADDLNTTTSSRNVQSNSDHATNENEHQAAVNNEQKSNDNQPQSRSAASISDGADLCTEVEGHGDLVDSTNKKVDKNDEWVSSSAVQSLHSYSIESLPESERLESFSKGSELQDNSECNKEGDEEMETSSSAKYIDNLTELEKNSPEDPSPDVPVNDTEDVDEENETDDSSSLTAATTMYRPCCDVANDDVEDLVLPSFSPNGDEDSTSELKSESDTENFDSAELKSDSEADNFNSAQSQSDQDNADSDDEFSNFETAPVTIKPDSSNSAIQEGFAAFSSANGNDNVDDNNWANFEGPINTSQSTETFGDFNQNSQVGGKSDLLPGNDDDDDFGDFNESGFAGPSSSMQSDNWASAFGFSPNTPGDDGTQTKGVEEEEDLRSILSGCFPDGTGCWADLTCFMDQLESTVDRLTLPRPTLPNTLTVPATQKNTNPDVLPVVENLWKCLRDLEKSMALKYLWVDSTGSKKLFAMLKIDARNILMIGHKKQPVPLHVFATGLGILEPTRQPLEPTKSPQKVDTLVDTSKTETSTVPITQEIPPAQFDWSSSGLTNPLDGERPAAPVVGEAKSTSLNLDLLAVNEGKQGSDKSKVFESDLLSASEQMRAPPKSLQPLESILATMKFNPTTVPQIKHERDENLSEEASQIIHSLPDLSFMQAKVLMFPIKAVGGENGQM